MKKEKEEIKERGGMSEGYTVKKKEEETATYSLGETEREREREREQHKIDFEKNESYISV